MADKTLYDAVILEWKQFLNITVFATKKNYVLNDQANNNLFSLSTNIIKMWRSMEDTQEESFTHDIT
jgi:hypothetical protein